MADLKSVMVEHLRQLAHAHLGRARGSRQAPPGLLRTLVRGVRGLARRMGLWPAPPPADAATASPSSSPEEGSGVGSPPPDAPQRPLPGDDDEKTPVRLPLQPVRVVTFPPKPKPKPQSSLADEEITQESPAFAPPLAEPPPPGEPLVEGFFVARIAGEGEAERHHLALPPAAFSGPPEGPGGLPRHYADDAFLLLPRDPHTLFALWDFSDASRQHALRGLEVPRAVLRLFSEERLLAVIDVALEVRGYYLHGLPAGRTYRLEAHFVGQDGTSHRIGPPSNRVALPPEGPSADTSVRLLRMPPRTTQRLAAEPPSAPPLLRQAPVEERSYITWRRVDLPGSAEALELAEHRRERVPPAPLPTTPAESPAEYLQVRRVEGSSEQRPGGRGPDAVLVPPPVTAPEGGVPEGWTWSRGPVGSSEQRPGIPGPGVPGPGVQGPGAAPPSPAPGAWWFGSSGPVGSSEQAPPPPGQGPGPSAAPPSAGPPGEGPWFGSSGPVGSSERSPTPGRPAPVSSPEVGHWYWSLGPVGSSEQGPGASGPPLGEGSGAPTAWRASSGPAGSSEQGPGAPGAEQGIWRWVGSSGPAGSSEQGPGAPTPQPGAGTWVWWYGPVGDAERGAPGRGEVSERWVWSRGPTGSSEQWVGSFGPAGASEQTVAARSEAPSSRER
jgi:hypothetical protein